MSLNIEDGAALPPSPPLAHWQRMRLKSSPPQHQALVKALTRRFYEDEQGTLIDNGLSTALICFPSDLEPRHAENLSLKIHEAMEYATSFRDVKEINALMSLAPSGKEPDYHVVLGLYLYFADECSRLGCDKSFLTALRDAKVGEYQDKNPNRDELMGKFMKALKSLKMDKSHGHILEEWTQKGSYTVCGDVHKAAKTDYPEGAYARLARDICMQKKFVDLHLAISYAIGNESKIQGKSAEDVYEMTRALATDHYRGDVDDYIKNCIKKGNDSREKDILKIIKQEMGVVPGHKKAFASRLEAPMAREIFNGMPDAALELLYREGYAVAHTNSNSVAAAYPKKDLPTVDATVNNIARNSKALRELGHRVIFLSNGKRRVPDDLANDSVLRAKVADQSLLHETFHMATSHLDDKEITSLVQAVDKVHDTLAAQKDLIPEYFNAPLKTMDWYTLARVTDFQDKMYGNYIYNDNEKRLEVACNLYGLLHTEYPVTARENNPYLAVPAMAELAKRIEEAVDTALTRSRAKTPNITISGQSASV